MRDDGALHQEHTSGGTPDDYPTAAEGVQGMSMLDFFAAHIIAGLYAGNIDDSTHKGLARTAYDQAAAMMRERARRSN
jgi:hypothetical protein